jgi:hypothetical protein
MKPAWEQLEKSFEGNTGVAIVDVDCTADDSKDLCSKYGVKGYPTIKYFTDSTDPMGDKYEGGRTFDDLKKWCDENLGPSCSSANLDLCSDAQKAEIKKFSDMTPDEREAEAKRLGDLVDGAEKTFKDEVAKLQANYEKLQKDKDATVAEHSPDLRVVRGVINDAKKAAEKTEKDEL